MTARGLPPGKVLLDSFISSFSDAVVVLQDGCVIQVNKAMEYLVGALAPDLRGRPWTSFLKVSDIVCPFPEGEEPLCVDLLGPEGLYVPVCVFLLSDAPFTVTDTSRLKALRICHLSGCLSCSAAILPLIHCPRPDNTGACFYRIMLDGVCSYVSPALVGLLGYTEQDDLLASLMPCAFPVYVDPGRGMDLWGLV